MRSRFIDRPVQSSLKSSSSPPPPPPPTHTHTDGCVAAAGEGGRILPALSHVPHEARSWPCELPSACSELVHSHAHTRHTHTHVTHVTHTHTRHTHTRHTCHTRHTHTHTHMSHMSHTHTHTRHTQCMLTLHRYHCWVSPKIMALIMYGNSGLAEVICVDL